MSVQTVHLRVNDTATGKPTAVRVRVSDPADNHYLPLGHATPFPTKPNQDVGGKVLIEGRPHFYIDGACEIALPAGPLEVHLSKGPEYRAKTEHLQLPAGKLALRLDIERWTDERSKGWYSGDARAHFLTPHAALLEAQAEDLAVVNLLATRCELEDSFFAIPNLLAFSGQRPCLEVAGHMVAVNTHNVNPQLGSLGLLHCHRVVHPLHFGGPDGSDDWTLADWCDQCHRKKGLVVWTRASHGLGEALADLVLGKIDAFEITSHHDLETYYALLNAGLRVPLVGASGKDSNAIALGALRTYARLEPEQPLTYTNWIEAVRAGRTYVTSGPLLSVDVASLTVRVEARSAEPIERIEFVHNGMVIAHRAGSASDECVSLEREISSSLAGWLAVRCFDAKGSFAHTSPVWLATSSPDANAVRTLIHDLQATRIWAETMARCSTSLKRENLVAIFRSALARLRERGASAPGDMLDLGKQAPGG